MKTFSLYKAFGKAHAELDSAKLNRPLFRRQRGASAIEYVIIAALIAVGMVATAKTLGVDITEVFTDISGELDTAIQ